MNVDITNHLIPWTQVKRMIQEARREACDEGEAAGQDNARRIDYNPKPDAYLKHNPYAENE